MSVPHATLSLLVLSGLVALLGVVFALFVVQWGRQQAAAESIDARLRDVHDRVSRASDTIRSATSAAASTEAAPEPRETGPRRRTRRSASPTAPPARP